MPAFRRADPVVLACEGDLDRAIRWVHATELSDVGNILRAGDLVLTVGGGLPDPDDSAALDEYARTLAEVGCVGVVVELGRRWTGELPSGLVAAFEAHSVPLVALTHETQFAALTQAIGERIIDSQLAELRDAHRVHETFTELSFSSAGPAEILDAVQRLTGGPVVLESGQHRPLDYRAGAIETGEMGGFLDGWQARSTRVRIAGRTGWDERNGWLVTRLGTSQQGWGRLVIASPDSPTERLIAVAERAAAALALHRLYDRDRDNLMRRTHRELMAALVSFADPEEVTRRCELAGFPLQRRSFLGLVLRPREVERVQADLNEIAAAAVRAAHAVRVPALVCEVEGEIRILLSVPGTAGAAGADTLADRMAVRVRRQHDVLIAAGRAVDARSGIERTLLEATHVADAVPPGHGPADPMGAGAGAAPAAVVHRLQDVHLRGLLALLGDDDRLRLFAERELAPLRAYDVSTDSRQNLMGALRAFLLHPTSKTDAAASLHLSRAAFYDRLAKIAQLLGADLDDPDIRVSLHVALLTDEVSGSRPR